MELLSVGNPWIWHPGWVNTHPRKAGGFLHFSKTISLAVLPSTPVSINMSADTRYKLYINKRFVHYGPVKGDERRWFYDTIDISPFLRQGDNTIAVHILRFHHDSGHSWTFARMPIGGLFIRTIGDGHVGIFDTDATWDTAIDPSAQLVTDDPFDSFLVISETVDKRNDNQLQWVKAQVIDFPFEPVGIGAPWRLSPRIIPFMTQNPVKWHNVHNVRSLIAVDRWNSLLVPQRSTDVSSGMQSRQIVLPSSSSHHIEIEVENHTTAFLAFRFAMGLDSAGTKLTVTYSECYEDEPFERPWSRRKTDRTDTTKMLIGPQDVYVLGGAQSSALSPCYSSSAVPEEVYQPFHYRTFRYLAVDIEVPSGSEATLMGIDILETRYPLEVLASFDTGQRWTSQLWSISIRTLENCMHDCYEDCPFYEQMQYAMDTRSSCLFTYLLSGDDRLARQAIMQIHDTFCPSIGLVAARSTDNFLRRQYIPPFALYWVCMVVDHHTYHGDTAFTCRFLNVCESILDTFASQIDKQNGLILSSGDTAWEFTDWTTPWSQKPVGVPTAVARTGVSSYINCLYSYTLGQLATLYKYLDKQQAAAGLRERSKNTADAVASHCYDGAFFTDGLAHSPIPMNEYSQHSQVWAVLCGAATGLTAERIMRESLTRGDPDTQKYGVPPPSASQHHMTTSGGPPRFTMTSISFSFYTFRAMAAVGGTVYTDNFHALWAPWMKQVAENVTTWAEDAVSIRSDCHAWGSVPIYEFVAEVAGLKPAAPGWSKLSFKPRLELFSELKTSLPIKTKNGKVIIEISWEKQQSPYVTIVRLHRRSSPNDYGLTVVVELPDREAITLELNETLEFSVEM